MVRRFMVMLCCIVFLVNACAIDTRISSKTSQAGITVDRLRCEYRINPLGIDVLQPRLSWIFESNQRGHDLPHKNHSKLKNFYLCSFFKISSGLTPSPTSFKTSSKPGSTKQPAFSKNLFFAATSLNVSLAH